MFSPVNLEKMFGAIFGICFCSFSTSKRLQYFSNSFWQLPVCSPPKSVNIWHNKLMKKTLHKQLFRGFSENIHGEVQFL